MARGRGQKLRSGLFCLGRLFGCVVLLPVYVCLRARVLASFSRC